jgi:hypothetical protein
MPFSNCQIDFLRQVLAGKKNLLLSEELIPTVVPLLSEFSVRRIYDYFKNDERVMSFLPDITSKASKLPNREWVTTVVCSLKPTQMNFAIERAIEARQEPRLPRNKQAMVEISPEYAELLQTRPFIASKFQILSSIFILF